MIIIASNSSIFFEKKSTKNTTNKTMYKRQSKEKTMV